MSKLETSFSEAATDPNTDERDPETVDLHSRAPPNATQNTINVLNEALKGNFDPIEKVRASQSTPISEGVKYFNDYVNFENTKILTRHYYPNNCDDPNRLPLMIFIHGGGWCLSSVEHRNHFASELAKRHNLEVVSINNSLSPDVKFGRALDEQFAVYLHLLKQSSDSRLIFLCGDSSGGNQVPCLTHKIIDNKVSKPTAILLFYPVIDLINDYPSYKIYKSGFSLDYDLMRKYIECYCPDPEWRKSPLASPILGDLHPFPPTLVITSQFDILRNEGLAFAKKLDESGVKVRYICMESAEHGFLNHPGLKKLENICHSHISNFLNSFI